MAVSVSKAINIEVFSGRTIKKLVKVNSKGLGLVFVIKSNVFMLTDQCDSRMFIIRAKPFVTS